MVFERGEKSGRKKHLLLFEMRRCLAGQSRGSSMEIPDRGSVWLLGAWPQWFWSAEPLLWFFACLPRNSLALLMFNRNVGS